MKDEPTAAEPSRSYPMVVLLRDGRPVAPETPPPPSRRRWLGPLAAVVLLAGGLIWLVLPQERPVAEAPWRQPAAAVAALQVPAPTVTSAAAARAPETASLAEGQSIEICGVGRFTRAQLEADEDLLSRTLEKPLQQALVSTLAQMRDHAEPRTRAAFLAMTYGEAQQAIERETSPAGKDACADAACSAVPPEALAARDVLLQMAATSNDPFVLQMGMLICPSHRTDRSAACARALISRWIDIEPRNAVPWMHFALMAQVAKDERALAQAMKGIATAAVVDTRHGLFTHELTRHVDATAEPLLALSLTMQGYGVEAARVWPIQPVTRHCEAAALNDGARRNECERIAMLFTEQSRQLLDFSIGVAIGKRLGWSADRLERLEVQKDAMIQAAIGLTGDAQDFTSCHAMTSQRAMLADTVELGEMGAWRKRIAASGQTEAQLAARYREARRRDSEAAVLSASAGSTKASGEGAAR